MAVSAQAAVNTKNCPNSHSPLKGGARNGRSRPSPQQTSAAMPTSSFRRSKASSWDIIGYLLLLRGHFGGRLQREVHIDRFAGSDLRKLGLRSVALGVDPERVRSCGDLPERRTGRSHHSSTSDRPGWSPRRRARRRAALRLTCPSRCPRLPPGSPFRSRLTARHDCSSISSSACACS